MAFIAPKELIDTVSDWIRDSGYKPPAFLQDKYEVQIVHVIAAAILCVALFLFFWPLIGGLFWNRTAADKLFSRFGKNGFVRAAWGEGVAEADRQWLDETINKIPLTERVQYLLRSSGRNGPVRANHLNLELPPDFLPGIPKRLKLSYPDGSFLTIDEGKEIRIDAAMDVFPGHGSGLTKQEFNRHITSIQEIIDQIPYGGIRQNDDWKSRNDEVNLSLRAKIIGRKATMDLVVDVADITRVGRYQGTPCVLALLRDDEKTKLQFLVYAYFNKANRKATQQVLSHKRHDPIRIRGKITRTDIYRPPDKGYCLNVDLSDCVIVT